MREIKFRAWDTMAHKMEPVGEITFDTGLEVAIGNHNGKTSSVNVQYQPHIILMQYTGLHDKNGREIYEGDIVDIGLENQDGKLALAPVIYGEYIAGYVLDNGGNGIWQRLTKDCEVIGNIFEDGGLIDGKGSATN